MFCLRIKKIIHFSFFFFNLIESTLANIKDPYQTPHHVVYDVASDLGLHCLPVSHEKVV